MQSRSMKGAAALWAGFLVGPAFFLLAAFFLLGPDLSEIPETEGKRIHEAYLSVAPRRAPIGDPPVIHIDGYDRTCMDCHKLFPPREEAPEILQQHVHIKMNHGINTQCRNCHDLVDRDRLVLHTGESIAYSEVVRLCAKCHGPTYRDWEWGMHGRTNGYWDSTLGAMIRLACTECHDPHNPRVPAMDPLKPLPPPFTLRMGEAREYHGTEEPDPLRQAIERNEKLLRRKEAQR